MEPNISRQQLERLRQSYFLYEIGAMYNVGKWTIWNMCRKLGIMTQPTAKFKQACKLCQRDVFGSKNSFFGRSHTVESKNVISEKAKQRLKDGQPHPWRGRKHTEASKAKMSASKKGTPSPFKGKEMADEQKHLLSIKAKERYKDKRNHPSYGRRRVDSSMRLRRPEIQQEMRKRMMVKPTKPEQRFADICLRRSLLFKYVGDGDVFIGTKNPDFININGKKEVVEIFGRVFHDPAYTFKKSIPYRQTYEGTIEHYKSYGFNCVIIWEDELRDESLVLDKLGYKECQQR